MKKFLLFLFLFSQIISFAQNKVATIFDTESGEPIPFANIKVGTNSNNISNGEGKFNIAITSENETTVIEVSYIGYETQQLTIKQLEKQNFIIKLKPGVYELNNVDVSDKKEDVASIMAKVKANLKDNYTSPNIPLNNTIFIRE